MMDATANDTSRRNFLQDLTALGLAGAGGGLLLSACEGQVAEAEGKADTAQPASQNRKEAPNAMRETARKFFHACESGKGWDACRQYCHPDASFSAQAGPLSDIDTVEGYTGWMQGQHKVLSDIEYDITSLAADEDRSNVCACAVLRGTHTGEGGPVSPTGKSVESEYAYVMEFDGDKIAHVTKIWNAPFAMRQLGWA